MSRIKHRFSLAVARSSDRSKALTKLLHRSIHACDRYSLPLDRYYNPAIDYARLLKTLVDKHYPEAVEFTVVQDNLNTHSPASLYKAFELKPNQLDNCLTLISVSRA